MLCPQQAVGNWLLVTGYCLFPASYQPLPSTDKNYPGFSPLLCCQVLLTNPYLPTIPTNQRQNGSTWWRSDHSFNTHRRRELGGNHTDGVRNTGPRLRRAETARMERKAPPVDAAIKKNIHIKEWVIKHNNNEQKFWAIPNLSKKTHRRMCKLQTSSKFINCPDNLC